MNNFTRTLALAALMTGVATFSANAEIAMNTDTGVNVKTVMESGLKPDTRLFMPDSRTVNNTPVQGNVDTLKTVTVMNPGPSTLTTATALQPARDQLPIAQAEQITEDTSSTLVQADADRDALNSNPASVQPRGNTLSNMGTTLQAPLDTETTSPVYQPSPAALARAPLDRDTTGTASIGAQTSLSANQDLNSSLATQGAIGNSTGIADARNPSGVTSNSNLNVNPANQGVGSVSGTAVGSSSLSGGSR